MLYWPCLRTHYVLHAQIAGIAILKYLVGEHWSSHQGDLGADFCSAEMWMAHNKAC